MTFLDASALIAFIRGEPAMESVLTILRRGLVAMAAVNIAEVFDRASRGSGLSHVQVAALIEPLFAGPIVPVPVDADLARRAGELRSRHYHRKHRPISLADAVLLAAPGSDDEIATSDSHVLAIAAELGIETIELPRSSG